MTKKWLPQPERTHARRSLQIIPRVNFLAQSKVCPVLMEKVEKQTEKHVSTTSKTIES